MRKFFANLKAVVGAVVMVSMLSTAALSTSCSDYDDEINNLQGQIDDLAGRVAQLESDFLSLAGVLDGIVLNAEQNADGNWVVTTDGGKINITVEGDFEAGLAEGGITVIEEDGVYYWAIIENGEAAALTVDGAMVPVVNDVTLAPEVRQNPVSGKTEFTVDGSNWYEIGVVFQDVAVEGSNLVLTLGSGDQVSVPMAQQLVFEINSGKAFFTSEQTRVIRVITENIEALSVLSAPKGWKAAINADNALEVTAPNEADTEEGVDYETWTPIPAKADATGEVKVLAYGADGRTLVGKLTVTIEAGVAVTVSGTNVVFEGGDDWYWPVDYVYGISTEENFVADVMPVLEAIKQFEDVPEYATWGTETVTTTIAELLGAEPVVGTRYVVWAYAHSNSNNMELADVAYSYYNPIGVTATLIEEKTNAYNIEVSLEVEGADSYLAVVIPESYMNGTVDEVKATMVESLMIEGNYYGKVWEENYTGSLEGITADTNYSMTGQYTPNQSWYMLVLPFDGRAMEDYTIADVYDFTFSTTNLEGGGAVNAIVAEVDKYTVKEYSYEVWDYVTVEKEVDPLTQIAVSIEPTDKENWIKCYYNWFTAEELALAGTDEDIIKKLTETYPIELEDVDAYPSYLLHRTMPSTEITFVGFYVDKNGKYGELAKLNCKTDDLAQSEMTLTVASNLSGAKKNKLANTTTLELTLTPSSEASMYKYVAQETTYYNNYEGKDAAAMAMEIALSKNAYEIALTDLVDGVWSYENHEFGNPYYLAILAYDAQGLPCKEAVIFEYECTLSFENVITDEAQFVAEPTVEFVPFTYVEGGSYEGGSYWYADQREWYDCFRYNFYFGYTFTTPEGCAEAAVLILPDEDNYIGCGDFTANDKCADLWSGKWSYYTNTTDGEYERSTGYYNATPYNIYLMLSWKDTEGNVYYKEVNLSETLLADAIADLDAKVAPFYAEEHAEKLTDQWVLPADVAAVIAAEGAEGIVDLGVSAEGQMQIAFDLESIYGADAAGVWQTMMSYPYTIEPTSTTAGNIVIAQMDMFGDTNYTNVAYSIVEDGVEIDFSFLGCAKSKVTPYDGEVTLEAGGGMMM